MPKIVKKYGKITLVLGLILVLVVMHVMITSVQAADLTKERDTLSDSRPSVISKHTVIFRATTAVPLSGHVIVDLPDAFTTPAMDYTDVAIYWDASDPPTTECVMAAACGAANCCVTVTTATDTVDITLKSGAGITAADYVKVVIGDGAAGGWEDITNPTAATYTIDLTTQTAGQASIDTGKCMVAIIAGVTVSVTVAESLSVTVNAVTPTDCTTTDGTEVTTTSTTVPFATVTPEAFYDGCQRVDVGTNAANGYGATVQKTQLLTCSSYTIADGSCDGGGSPCSTTTAAGWATASNNGFGYCMDDVAGNAAETADANWATYYCGAATQYFKLIGTLAANAKTIMSSAGPVSGDQSYIGYRLSVDAAQTACTPYETVISYVVTPTY